MDITFYQLIIDSLLGKVIFKQSYKKGEGLNHRDIWGMKIIGIRNNKDPEVEQANPVGWIQMIKEKKGRRWSQRDVETTRIFLLLSALQFFRAWGQWTWPWANFGRWSGTGKSSMLQYMESQRVGHNWVTEKQQGLRAWTFVLFSVVCLSV